MKKSILLILSALSLSMITQAYAVNDGGTNTGGSNSGSAPVPIPPSPIENWCAGSIGILNERRDNALNSEKKMRTEEAVKTLILGLIEAKKKEEELGNQLSYTYRTILRGLEIGNALYVKAPELPDGMETPLSVLFSFYQWIEEVSGGVDKYSHDEYYRISQQCKLTCTQTDIFKQLAKYDIEYSSMFIDWMMTNFVREIRSSPRSVEYTPKTLGSKRALLMLYEFITGYVYLDLSTSLRAPKVACVLQDLRVMHDNLQALNLGNTSAYEDDRDALNTASPRIKNISKRIKSQCFK